MTLSPPNKVFQDYHNLFVFCERKCLACFDHYAYDADIVAGDVWSYRLRADPIKKSGILVRTAAGLKAFQSAADSGAVIAEPIDVRDIMDGQNRIGPAHYHIGARARLAPRFGIKLKDPLRQKPKWHAYLNALITLSNVRLSESPIGQRLIFAIPRPILKPYLYLKKALESLQ
jgi:hypothetical protein